MALEAADRVALTVLALLVVAVLTRMALRDMSGPIDVDACVRGSGDAILSKHLHCVSKNTTGSFADFLQIQGAKKEHPYYAAERARLRGERGERGGERPSRAQKPHLHRSNNTTNANEDVDFMDPRVGARLRQLRRRRRHR